MAHCLLTTFGSLGDLHPYIAVGRGLRARGHTVTIATSGIYRAKVEGEGLDFHAVRPDMEDLLQPDTMDRSFHPRTGTEFIVRKLVLPLLERSYEDLLQVAQTADVLLGHPIAFATPMVAEKLQKRWMSIALAPLTLPSRYDPPAISGAPLLDRMRGWGPGFWGLFWFIARLVTRGWGAPVNRLRGRLGLRQLKNPILDDMFSPYGTQAWFTSALAQPQPDWPDRTEVTGFPFYDRLVPGEGMSLELSGFLNAGPAPVVFTLGSSAVMTAGNFYAESLSAAERLGCRAVLLVGRDVRNLPRYEVSKHILLADYAPYSELFPRAAATVHQGGIGTTAQALRSGRPMIVVPYSHDQPDNAARVTRLGVAKTIPRGKYRAARAVAELGELLKGENYGLAASAVAAQIAVENGVERACDGIERLLRER